MATKKPPRGAPVKKSYGFRAGTTQSRDELAARGVKKPQVYLRRPTWMGLDALAAERGLGSYSEVVADLVREATGGRFEDE